MRTLFFFLVVIAALCHVAVCDKQPGAPGKKEGFDLRATVQSAIDFLQDPNSSAFFRVQFLMKYVVTTIYYVTLHFLVWDYSDTRPDEFINVNNQINFFTNPEIVLSNLGIVLGHAAFLLLFWTIPVFFWRGQPLPEGPLEGHNDRADGEQQQQEESVYETALRRNTCPNCVLNIILIDTLTILGILAWWTFVPMTRLNGSKLRRRRRRRRREAEAVDVFLPLLKKQPHADAAYHIQANQENHHSF